MNQKEKEILTILANSKKELSLSDIMSMYPHLVKSTVAATLAKLLEEEFIVVSGISRSGKVYARTYSSTEKAHDFLLKDLVEEYNSVSNFISKADACIAFFQSDKNMYITRDEIAKLHKMIDDFEKSTNKNQ